MITYKELLSSIGGGGSYHLTDALARKAAYEGKNLNTKDICVEIDPKTNKYTVSVSVEPGDFGWLLFVNIAVGKVGEVPYKVNFCYARGKFLDKILRILNALSVDCHKREDGVIVMNGYSLTDAAFDGWIVYNTGSKTLGPCE